MEQRESDAVVKDAPIELSKEVCCAFGMGQRSNYASAMDVPIKPTEECARSTARGSNYAVVTDAQMEPSKEECASGMEQRKNTNDAAARDAQINLKLEECAFDMGQSSNDAALKGAQIKPNVVVYVGGMGQTATIHTMNQMLFTRDESTGFGSEYENTTVTLTPTNQGTYSRASTTRGRRSSVPGEVTILCQEIVEV